jgi:hypothetical protein
MIDMLALEIVFLGVLFAVLANVRWRARPKNRKNHSHDVNSSAPHIPHASSPPPRQEIGSDSMKAVAKALDEAGHQQGQATASKTSTTTGTLKKSVWRLVGGCLLLAGASNSLRNPSPEIWSGDPVSKITYFAVGLLLAGIGAGLAISYLAKRPRGALLIMSVAWLLIVASMVYSVLKSSESNNRFGNAVRAFSEDANQYWEDGAKGNPPTLKATGDATNDSVGRVINGVFQEIAPVIANMNRELGALEEKGVFETSVLSNKTTLETEARKRIDSQRAIARYRNDLPRAFDGFQKKLESYNMPDNEEKNALAGFQDARATFSQKSETMFNLLGKKEKAEFDFLSFMAGAFNEYKLNNRKISFQNPVIGQRYGELAKNVEDTAEEIAAFRKEWGNDLNANIQKLSR